ncbi:MAG TPA: hypothetical protein VGG98_08100 [Solirubrobacteraceae bacterium]|jgi:hypothetical protein
MSKIIYPILAFVAVFIAAMGLAACGGASGDVVAHIGPRSITKDDVNHWMSTLAGGDFYEISGRHTVPAGLVSEPPNYGACVSNLEAAAANASTRLAKTAAAQLLSKCRQLYQALKLQAVGYLVEAWWLIGLDGEEGVKATDGEVRQLFNKTEAEQFPKEGELQQYLARNRRSLADEMFVVKLDLLQQKTQKKITTGGKQMLAKFTEAGQRWTAKTSCRAGYVVQHCKQYTGTPASSTTPSAAVLLEQVAAITGRPCINHPACGQEGNVTEP